MPRKTDCDDHLPTDLNVGLRLSQTERDILLTSAHVADDGLRKRVHSATPQQVISFTLDELEDLHRGLAFEADRTDNTKRAKTIRKVLRKIDEMLGRDEELQGFVAGEFLNSFHEVDLADAASLPALQNEMLDMLFNSVGAGPAETEPKFRLRLPPAERLTLRQMETIALDVQKMASSDSPDAVELQLNMRQMFTTMLAIKEAIAFASNDAVAKPYQDLAQRIAAGMMTSIEALEAMPEEREEIDDERRYRESQQSPAKLAFQLKITLDDSKPPIWRRVLVADCTLDVLHQITQMAMGWTNSHLHQFEFDGSRFHDPRCELEVGYDDYDETTVLLSQLVDNGCKKLHYDYDFGDGWSHTIAIEKKLAPKPTDKFPVCVKGVGACPPEDCGGIWGYYDLLEALRDPEHDRHEEATEWVDEDFDPEKLDLGEINEALAISLPPRLYG